jgi:hypothetical protein
MTTTLNPRNVTDTFHYPPNINRGIVEISFECGCTLWYHPDLDDKEDWRDLCDAHQDPS